MKNSFIIGLCLLGVGACASVSNYLQGESLLYRQLHLDSWVDNGADLAVMQKTLQTIDSLNKNVPNNRDIATQEYASGNWQYEWDQAAQQAIIQQDFLAATTYYTIAAYPFIKNDKLSNQSYDSALTYYQYAVENDGNYIEEIRMSTAKGTAYAYLHLPEKAPSEVMPVVVFSNGSDHTLTSLYDTYRDYIKPRGWAMVSLDLPGIGSNSQIDITTSETNFIHQQLIKYLKQEPRVNSDKIALVGSSFSGNAVTKTAFTNPQDIVAAASVCGVVNTPFLILEFALKQVPQMTADGFLSRFNMTRKEVIETSSELALSTHYLGKEKTPVPLLMVGLGNDKISPPKDMKLVANSSVNGRYVIVGKDDDDGGHCPSDANALPVVMDWLQEVAF